MEERNLRRRRSLDGGGAAASPSPLKAPSLWGMVLSVGLLACGHTLETGDYQLAAGEILRDTCGLAEEEGLFAVGHLRRTGDVVLFGYDFFGIQLAGFYLASKEVWRADGNVGNVFWHRGGKACKLEEIRMSIEARTQSRGQFEGTLLLSTHSESMPECVCELWAGYEAHIISPEAE